MKTIRSKFTPLAIRFSVALSGALLVADISSHLMLAEDVPNTLSATLSSLKGTAVRKKRNECFMHPFRILTSNEIVSRPAPIYGRRTRKNWAG